VGQRFLPWLDRATAAQLHVFHPEILHLHDFSPVGLAGLRAVRALNVPAVLTLHLLPPTLSAYAPPLPGLRQMTDAGLWAYYEWVAQQCQAVATPTRASADIVRAHCRCDPVVLPNGVQLARFSPRPQSPDEGERLRRKYRLDPHRPVILSVGRIDVEKRMDVVVRAAAQAMRSVQAQLLVVGDGTRRAATIRLSEELRIRDHCQFPGYVSAAGDLPGLYRLAVVFVMASEMETQGLAGLEAAASGLPVIAVRATALAELVHDGLNGYLVAPGDVEAMAEQMRFLLQNPEHARKMGEAARTLAEHHSLESALAAHEQFYQSILSGSRN
jgi:glycosyltransferase involved in cell wall biosynthesis